MSASAEDLLIQILLTEDTIKNNKQDGLSTAELEKKLLELQDLFQSMNENLTNKGTLLKG